MRRIGLALFLLAASGSAAARSPVGHYRLVGEPDVAAELVLREDGSFSYGLAAGALDERAEGRWTHDGQHVRLTTEPRPTPAQFEAAAASRTDEGPLRLKVTWPGGRGIAGVEFRVGLDSGEEVEGYTQEDGWELAGAEGRKPQWVQLALPMYGLVSDRFPIDPATANDLRFVLVPNDLGVFDFRDQSLEVGEGRLAWNRNGTDLTFAAED